MQLFDGFFHSKKTGKCAFCKSSVDKKKPFILQYNTADGLQSSTLCNQCAETFDLIIKERDETYDNE